MSVRHALAHPVRRAAAALLLSCAVIAPASAHAYTKNPPNVLTATCTGSTATFTWDVDWGKPSTWTISNSTSTFKGRFTKLELTNASKSVDLDCSAGGWDLYLTSGRSGSSMPFTY